MSFTNEDKDLLEKLLSIAQVNNNIVQPIQIDSIKDVAQKLIEKLRIDTSNSFTSDQNELAIMPKDLVSLDTLLQSLDINKVKYNNLILVYPFQGSNVNAPKGEYAKIYFLYPNTDNQENSKYWVYKDGLTNFIRTLQKQGENNKLLNVYVKKLIEQINNNFTEMQQTESVKSKSIDLDKVIDYLPSPISLGKGNIPLKGKDLQSKDSFISFLEKNIKFNNNNKLESIDETTPTNIIFNIINLINIRAQNIATNRGFEDYNILVKQLANLYNCPLVKTNISNNNNETITSESVVEMSQQKQPLVKGLIVFAQIEEFAKAFSKIYPNSSITQELLNELNTIKAYGKPSLGLRGQNYTELDKQIKNLSGNSASQYIELVSVMLDNTAEMLREIQSLFRNYGTGNQSDNNGNERFKSELDEQIRNIYPENRDGLRILNTQLLQELEKVHQSIKNRQNTW